MQIKFSNLILIPGLALFFACSSGTTTEETTAENSKDTVSNEQMSHAQIVLYNIPSPVETSQLLLDAGAKYDASYTNSPTKVKEYKTAEAQALNLGIYGSDLSFAGIFENSQECMSFMKGINSLCGDLGISGAFNENTAARLENNKKNRDSLLNIISNSFLEADGSLKENNRSGISSLLICGGWIEGMYIASKVYEKTKNEKIKTRMVCEPQSNALKSVIAMLENEKLSQETQSLILGGLKDLKSTFDKIPSEKSETKASTDSVKHITRLETSSNSKVGDELLTEISKKVNDLRNKVVSMK